jgi:hypothetical protein
LFFLLLISLEFYLIESIHKYLNKSEVSFKYFSVSMLSDCTEPFYNIMVLSDLSVEGNNFIAKPILQKRNSFHWIKNWLRLLIFASWITFILGKISIELFGKIKLTLRIACDSFPSIFCFKLIKLFWVVVIKNRKICLHYRL